MLRIGVLASGEGTTLQSIIDVFEAVLTAGESESGASVHLVEAEYDTGTVIRQERVPVLPEDTVESLAARVQACEREVVVETLAAIARGELALGTAR